MPRPAAPPARPSRARPEEEKRARRALREAEILDAAAAVFMEKGFAAASVEDVARALNCTKGRIYHYHASKTDLFFEVHRQGMARLFAAQETALAALPATAEGASDGGADGAARLSAMTRAHARAMLDHVTYETVVAHGVHVHRFGPLTEAQRAELSGLIAERDRFEALFKDALAAGMADGSLRPSDVSVTAKVLLGGLQWSIYWYRPRPEDTEESRAELAERMAAPLLDGLRMRS